MARSLAPQTIYGDEIGSMPLLTAEEERELALAIAVGDKVARARMIEANLTLVVKVAQRFTRRGLELDDLIAYGNIGLITAVERFDPAMGTRFATYAVYWIKQSIRSAIIKTGQAIRLPRHAYVLLGKWHTRERRLEHRLGRKPYFDEVASSLRLSKNHQRTIRHAISTREFESPPHAIHNVTIDPAESARRDEDRQHIVERLPRLRPNERFVISHRLGLFDGLPHTLDEVGQQMGICRERVRQVQERASQKLAAGVFGS